jgi:molybdenum cofactor cytidylyltransferase
MGTPKALLEYQGETFLDRLIGIFGQSCGSVTVVLGHDPGIRQALRRANEAQFVVNPDFELGQLSSLQCGLRAVPAGSDAIIFTPVDYPSIQPETVIQLIDAWYKSRKDALFVIPRFGERRGHPVLFSSAIIPDFLVLPPEAEARTVVRRNIERTRYVDLEDAGILRDIDDPQAYAELLKTASDQQ